MLRHHNQSEVQPLSQRHPAFGPVSRLGHEPIHQLLRVHRADVRLPRVYVRTGLAVHVGRNEVIGVAIRILAGGDMATLVDSLRKLTALPDDTIVVLGHGPCTTIAAERLGNPFLQ